MRQAHFLRGGLVLLAAGWVGSAGCTHNYYYGTPTAAGCAPTVAAPAGAVQYGSVCDVPTQVVGGANVVAQGPTRSTVVNGSPRPPQVIVSQPRGRGLFGWKPSDPDVSLPTTQVAGTVDDSTATR